MANYDDLFSFTAADALAETESKKKSFSNSSSNYKPSINDEKCTDQNYRAVIRFIPFIHEGKVRTTLERWECFLKDVNGNNGFYVVSPKTVGKKCPMRDLSYKLYTSNNAADKENSKLINVYQQWYALVEVVKDAQHPEFEGKIFIYQFGKKIYDKILEATKGSEYKDPINPFDFFAARLFEINLTKSASKVPGAKAVANYDSCGFLEKTAPIHFGDGQTLTQDGESKKAFIEWLGNGAPKISDLFFKEWDAETEEKVKANLATYVSGYDAPAPRTASAAAREVFEAPAAPAPAPAPMAAPAAPVAQYEVTDDLPAAGNEDEDWINSILG